jgi:hypothetical protein
MDYMENRRKNTKEISIHDMFYPVYAAQLLHVVASKAKTVLQGAKEQ